MGRSQCSGSHCVELYIRTRTQYWLQKIWAHYVHGSLTEISRGFSVWNVTTAPSQKSFQTKSIPSPKLMIFSCVFISARSHLCLKWAHWLDDAITVMNNFVQCHFQQMRQLCHSFLCGSIHQFWCGVRQWFHTRPTMRRIQVSHICHLFVRYAACWRIWFS